MLDPNGSRCNDASIVTLDANAFRFEKACKQDGVLRPDDAYLLFQKTTQEFLSESPQFLAALSVVADGLDIRQPEQDVTYWGDDPHLMFRVRVLQQDITIVTSRGNEYLDKRLVNLLDAIDAGRRRLR